MLNTYKNEQDNNSNKYDETITLEKKSYINVEDFEKIIVENYSSNLQKNSCSGCLVSQKNIFVNGQDEIIELDCKGVLGKHFCIVKKDTNVELTVGDKVVVKCPTDDSVDIAEVVDVGEIVNIKYSNEDYKISDVDSNFIRKANEKDLEQFKINLNDEQKAKPIFLKSVEKHELFMKLVDIHYQFDRKKLFFFYTSDGRVDFRELAKDLASHFKTRIELRQIGVRDEAKKIGGIGTCGREYCCSSYLQNFKRITTQIAADQNISVNLSKLSGPCGKLKCCLSYELSEDENVKEKVCCAEQ